MKGIIAAVRYHIPYPSGPTQDINLEKIKLHQLCGSQELFCLHSGLR